MLKAVALPLAFATWMALLNNFVVERAGFDGFDIGVRPVAREIHGFWGVMMTTILSSVGFHYYETINQSLQPQWLSKDRVPQVTGGLVSTGSFGSRVLAFLMPRHLAAGRETVLGVRRRPQPGA